MGATILNTKAEVETVKTGLSDDTRKRLAGHLSKALADTMLLTMKTQVYHWNVVGPLFKPIHDLTEAQYTNLFAAADEIAERIRALGHPAPLSFADLAPKANVSEESDIRSAEGMIRQLVKDHEAIVANMREAAHLAEKHDDFVTHDLLVARMGFHEKAIWMLRAMIADQAS